MSEWEPTESERRDLERGTYFGKKTNAQGLAMYQETLKFIEEELATQGPGDTGKLENERTEAQLMIEWCRWQLEHYADLPDEEKSRLQETLSAKYATLRFDPGYVEVYGGDQKGRHRIMDEIVRDHGGQ